MFLLIILLSYLLGCASTIALLLYLYTRYVVYTPVAINEHQEDQYESFKPLPENGGEKNSAVEAINYLFQFLFQELKDSSRLRRYLMHKLNTEFKELKNGRTGKIFLQNIVIQAFSIGKECPVFSDIHLEHQERDERNLIKGFVANLDADYKDGFSVELEITLLFGHKCRLFVKVKRIQGNLRLEFRREPFCHWLCVFQKEPLIDFEVKSYVGSGESPQLAQIITQQLRRAIKRKQTWPSYKIRLQPFFPTSKIPEPTEVLTPSGKNIIPGTFDVLIKYCDRLSIPLAIFDKQKASSVFVFLTISVNDDMCADYLHIKREQWPTKEILLKRNVHKLIFKEVSYMDRTELLIEDIDPLPVGIENESAFKAALHDKNVFLLKIQDQDAATSKQVNRLLKYKSAVPVAHDGTAAAAAAAATTTTLNNTDEDKIKIVVGMPVLHSVRVQRAADSPTTPEGEKLNATSPTLSTRSDHSTTASLSPSTTVRQRLVPPPVKFDKAASSIGLTTKQVDVDEEDTQSINTIDSSSKVLDEHPVKKPKQKTSGHDIVLIMMNTDLLQKFHAEPVAPRKSEPYIEFNHLFNFHVKENERFLNVCLWCKPPLNCDVQDPGKKLILLGYATVALSEIVLDAHMSYKHETQMTVNFRSPYAPKPNLNACLTEEESKKRMELSTHKGYDENLANGFVTINIKHWPEIEANLNPQEKKEQFIANSPILNDICTELKEKERKQDQLKYINAINEQHELPPRKPTDHIFEDKTFTLAIHCDYCTKKIWMKSGRHCRDCLINIHKKCEDRCNVENPCPHVPVPAKSIQISSPADDDSKSILNIELPDANTANSTVTTPVGDNIDSVVVRNNFEPISVPDTAMNNRTTALATPPTTVHRLSTKAVAAFSVIDSTARRSIRGAFGNKNLNNPAASTSPSLSATSELSKSDESLSNASTISGSSSIKISAAIPPAQTSSKLANAASSAYSRLREFKSRRLPAATVAAATTVETPPTKKTSTSSGSMHSEIVPEVDMREVISKILSDESNDVKALEPLLHERDIDDAALYAKAREFGPELFPEYTLEERKGKLEDEISRLRQEIDLQYQVRDDMVKEYENGNTDENEKRKLRERILNIDEKAQALGALTILNCYGLKHCRAQIEAKNDVSKQLIDEAFNEEDTNDFDTFHDDDDDDDDDADDIEQS
ncbi:unnamed protein product [Adineta ricciae]|uniref:Phorbol-ester/DAG-type domain-containing protein n=1 Tax=Adineta ricciae TaxID=249248 RepID=A0A814GR62_ADIRI|nr:unnamed protein product [Adineta ricciae]